MFSAIQSGSVEITQLLLNAGIDATIEYKNGKNAIAFAIFTGHSEIANLIALHIANGDKNAAQRLLDIAKASADQNAGPKRKFRIMPMLKDLLD